jgi:hypothetical protein
MIRYVRIGEGAWESLTRSMSGRQGGARTAVEFRTTLETFEFHQYQLDQWQRSIPGELGFSHADPGDTRSTLLLTVLHLRANQLRAVMIRRFLYIGTDSTTQLGKSAAAVEIAIDTIRVIDDLHARSDIYRRQQALFNYFLISALGVLYALITRDSKRETSSMTSDRLSPAVFANAQSGLFRGLDILWSLGTSGTYPLRLWNKLFPSISQFKVSQNHDDYAPQPVEQLLEPPATIPGAVSYNIGSQDHHQSVPLDPIIPATSSAAINTSQPTTQIFSPVDTDIMNVFEPGELYTADDILFDRYFGGQFANCFNDTSFVPPF